MNSFGGPFTGIKWRSKPTAGTVTTGQKPVQHFVVSPGPRMLRKSCKGMKHPLAIRPRTRSNRAATIYIELPDNPAQCNRESETESLTARAALSKRTSLGAMMSLRTGLRTCVRQGYQCALAAVLHSQIDNCSENFNFIRDIVVGKHLSDSTYQKNGLLLTSRFFQLNLAAKGRQ